MVRCFVIKMESESLKPVKQEKFDVSQLFPDAALKKALNEDINLRLASPKSILKGNPKDNSSSLAAN